MIRLLALIAACWALLTPLVAEAYELLVLQSNRSPSYDLVMQGFRSVSKASERLIVVSDYAEIDLQRIIREERPMAIVALGDDALALASSNRRLPVVAMMAASLRSYAGRSSITGVDVLAQPERYFQALLFMRGKRVGMLGSAAKSGTYMRRMQQLAPRYGIELMAREVASARDAISQLQLLKGKVDTLWLLPDTTAVARENVDAYFRFSMDHQVPVVAFSSAYLPAGAAVVVEIDRQDIGRQGGELVNGLLRGDAVENYPPAPARRSEFKTNPVVLRRFGLMTEMP